MRAPISPALRSVVSFAALLSATLVFPALAQQARPEMTTAQCNPLTEANRELCCVAINRERILTPSALDQCPPLTTSSVERALDLIEAPGTGNSGQPAAVSAPSALTTPTGASVVGTSPASGAGLAGSPDTRGNDNINAGPGDGAEGGVSEASDMDPGRSGENNNAGAAPGASNDRGNGNANGRDR
ncbi:hypothetical protein [Chelativorans sp.]|uniref:hypothetical protein n=1 Tax=Chelativorans sp. TaxID=2203393 RepID=UPI00281150B3|nr:hypothetical protein [Chelativorans sp.]